VKLKSSGEGLASARTKNVNGSSVGDSRFSLLGNLGSLLSGVDNMSIDVSHRVTPARFALPGRAEALREKSLRLCRRCFPRTTPLWGGFAVDKQPGVFTNQTWRSWRPGGGEALIADKVYFAYHRGNHNQVFTQARIGV
jgi:hypothetical protein